MKPQRRCGGASITKQNPRRPKLTAILSEILANQAIANQKESDLVGCAPPSGGNRFIPQVLRGWTRTEREAKPQTEVTGLPGRKLTRDRRPNYGQRASSMLSGVMFVCLLAAEPTLAATSVESAPVRSQAMLCSPVAIDPSDLPEGFIEIPTEHLMPISNVLQTKMNVNVEGIFLFLHPLLMEFLLGVTVTLSEEAQSAGYRFDSVDFPSLLEMMLVTRGQTVGQLEILEQRELPEAYNIGDSSVGFTTIARMSGVTVQVDTAMFRRRDRMAVTVISYPNGEVPVLGVGDIARQLDGKLVQCLEGDSEEPISRGGNPRISQQRDKP